MIKIKHILAILAIALITASCIRDETEDCLEGKYICFESIMKKYDYRDIVNNVDLFLYNESGKLVSHYSYLRQDLHGEDYMAFVPMHPAGNYTAVAVINNSDDYVITGMDRIETFDVFLKTDTGDTLKHKQADIYQGLEQIEFIERKNSIVDYDTLNFWKNTNHFYVTINYSGYEIPEGATLTAYIQGNNGQTDYRNDCPAECLRVYEPHEETYPTYFVFTTHKLWTKMDLQLIVRVENSDGTGFEHRISVAEALATNYLPDRIYDTDEKIWQEDEYYLSLKIGKLFALISINSIDWSVVGPPPIIIG
jgi:Protein of unknown function (DUF1812).